MMNAQKLMQQYDSSSPLIQFVAVVVVILGTVLLMATLNGFISKILDNWLFPGKLEIGYFPVPGQYVPQTFREQNMIDPRTW